MLTYQKILEKARRYCASQERAPEQVRQKFKVWQVPPSWWQDILGSLQEEQFLNEARFTKFYVQDKVRWKKWGRLKISAGLKYLKVSPDLIEKELEEIVEHDYLQTLRELAQKKSELSGEKDPLKRKVKVAQYLLSKGFEGEKIWPILEHLPF